MIPSRYALVDERTPYSINRRMGHRGDRIGDSAITLLPPDPYLIVERPGFGLPSSPTVYRTTAPKSAKNKEASSFVILGETVQTPVQSRPGSPSGRVSPFRGHGFKSPTATRPNSRAPSPSASPKRNQPSEKVAETTDRPRGPSRDIGKPPKSPMKPKPVAKPASNSNENQTKILTKEVKKRTDSKLPEAEATTESTKPEDEQQPSNLQTVSQRKDGLTPVTLREKKTSVSRTPRSRNKLEKNQTKEAVKQSVIKRATKPPIPPKKIGMKVTLKAEESSNESEKKSKKEEEPVVPTNDVQKVKEGLEGKVRLSEKTEEKSPKNASEKVTEEDKPETEKKSDRKEQEKVDAETEERSEKKAEEKGEQKEEKLEKKPEKLVPCFQPDKCQIAPPTMASPSPIITPTISTPSTTSSLAPAPTKTSPSIAAAPTVVTPSSLGAVSSTVVLGGHLARKEADRHHQQREHKSPPQPRERSPMVKAASRDSVHWSPKDSSLSGEITSTKVIAAGPDAEVLSPNNLRGSPPRVAPPNVAWDEGRVPNGDVPNRAQSEGKFRRALSAMWRFLGYLFCCRCSSRPKCCARSGPDRAPASSLSSGLSCFKCCRNPFKCCMCKSCSSKGCDCCRKLTCCRRAAEPKPKPGKCCAKAECSCKGCCDRLKKLCLSSRNRLNSFCRSLFCLNTLCCQKVLRKFKCCHKLKCCQKNGFCSCCNPNVKKKANKLTKKGSRTSNNSRDKDNLDVVLVEHTSLMKAAIPVLPSCLAVFCLILNLFVPGFGTFVSGVLCLCFGKPRFSVKDTPKSRVGSFVLNTVIGVAQLFTVVFCLVGWGWSIWWGVIMYKLSRRQKRLKLAEKNQKEAEGSNVNHNHVDVEQG